MKKLEKQMQLKMESKRMTTLLGFSMADTAPEDLESN
jgi:hypothetical protein